MRCRNVKYLFCLAVFANFEGLVLFDVSVIAV